MATNEWLKNHAKVTAYLDLSLYSSLENWMKTHKIKKVSQALVIILEHYLEGNIPTEVLPETLEQEVKNLKAKTTEIDDLSATVAEQESEFTDEIESLRTEIDQLRQALINTGLSSLKEKFEDIPRGNIDFTCSDTEISEGLTKTDLCKKINLTSSQINQWASRLNLTPDDYLLELTGWHKPPSQRRYFPSEHTPVSDTPASDTTDDD
jgi:chromosome segregation ATPase